MPIKAMLAKLGASTFSGLSSFDLRLGFDPLDLFLDLLLSSSFLTFPFTVTFSRATVCHLPLLSTLFLRLHSAKTFSFFNALPTLSSAGSTINVVIRAGGATWIGRP